jgi:hypothetical protein
MPLLMRNSRKDTSFGGDVSRLAAAGMQAMVRRIFCAV